MTPDGRSVRDRPPVSWMAGCSIVVVTNLFFFGNRIQDAEEDGLVVRLGARAGEDRCRTFCAPIERATCLAGLRSKGFLGLAADGVEEGWRAEVIAGRKAVIFLAATAGSSGVVALLSR